MTYKSNLGTSLPSLILSKIKHPPKLIITDEPSVIHVAQSCLTLNHLSTSASSLWVRSLDWGDINDIDSLLNDISHQWNNNKIDFILGSDTFYEPKDFDKLLMTIAYVIHHHNPSCKFITAYQERSSKRSIQFLLDQWSLQCRLISKDEYDFDESQFITNNGSINDYDDHNNIPHIKINAGTLSSVFLLEISAKESK
ncbi:unnamed protein product [Cunninghamella blakesleeana]